MKRLFGLLGKTFKRWSLDKAPKLAAALAYYSAFAIAPLILIAIGVAGLVFGAEAARGEIMGQLQGLIGQENARTVEETLQRVNKPRAGILATLLGGLALLFGASGVFGELQDSLNLIWKVEKKPGRGILGKIKDRFLSFTMVVGLGFLLLTSLVVSAGLAALGNWIGGDDAGWLLKAASFLVSLALIAGLFTAMFRFLPDARTPWKPLWIGGIVTAALFVGGKFALGAYLANSAAATAYGAAGAFLLVLVWVFYSAQILFFGAELTKTLAEAQGAPPRPDDDARRLRTNGAPAGRAPRGSRRRRRTARGREITIRMGGR